MSRIGVGVALLALACFGCKATHLPGGGPPASTGPDAGGPTPDAGSCVRGSYRPKGKRDHVGIYQPSTAYFYLLGERPGWTNDSAPSDTAFNYGNANWTPLFGDWDGDGAGTQGAWSGGVFYLSNSLGSPAVDSTFAFGDPSDIPVVGDWDGDGKDTIGVFRPSTGWWYLSNSNNAPAIDYAFSFGSPGDVPVIGDWDGDGKDGIGVFRNGTFYLQNALATGFGDYAIAFGVGSDKPVVGDWDGDGRDTIGIYRPSAFQFQLCNSLSSPNVDILVSLGSPDDLPVVGNWGTSPTKNSTAPSSLANFFPLAVDFQPSFSFSTWKSRGINTLIRWPGNDCCGANPTTDTLAVWTANANAAGLKMIRQPATNPADDNAEAGLLAWTPRDEPEGLPVSQLQTWTNQLRAVNPTRPIFYNFAGPLVLWQNENLGNAINTCNGPGDTQEDRTCYPGYIGAEDWVMNDIYPVNDGFDLHSVGKVMEILRRWAGGRPQLAYIEAAPYDTGKPAISPGQFRIEVWDAIIHGARGIGYFVVKLLGTNDNTSAEIRAEMTTQNAHITEIATALQTEINPATVGVRVPPPLEAGWRVSGCSKYLIVANHSNTTVPSAKLEVLGFTPATAATVMWESRTVGSAGNAALVDSFDPYAVHVYRVE